VIAAAITALPLTPSLSATSAANSGASTVVVDATAADKPKPLNFHIGTAVSPEGRVLGINSQHLTLNRSPWLPAMVSGASLEQD
jgi:hypothetical protein